MKIINYKTILLIFILVGISSFSLSAQMYNEINANQSVTFSRLKLSPAFVPENKVTFSILTSVGSSFTLPVSYDKIVSKNDKGETVLKLDNLSSNIRSRKFLGDVELDLLSLGIKVKDNFFSLQYGIGIETGLNFDKKFIDFLEKGSSSRLGKNIDVGKLDGNLTSYQQFVLGYANNSLLDGKLTLGARVKLRYGLANAHLKVNKLNVYTSTTDSKAIILDANTQLDFSAGSLLDVETGNKGELKDVKVKKNITYKDINTFKNLGIGFDFGASYKATQKLTVGLSISGLGKQNWKDNTYRFKQKGKRSYKDFDLSDPQKREQVIDSTLATFQKANNNKYSLPFNRKMRLDCSYDFTQSLNAYGSIGLLTMYEDSFPEFNFVGTYTPVNWFSLALGTRYLNEQINIGASLVLGTKLQLFLAVDDLIAMNYSSADQFGFRVGTSFNF